MRAMRAFTGHGALNLVEVPRPRVTPGRLDFVSKQRKRDASKAKITCAVTIGPRKGGGLGLTVKMRVEDKSLAQAELAAFVQEAHENSARIRMPFAATWTSRSK